MTKPYKIVSNSDPGDADHYGGNDIDNITADLNALSDFHTYTYFVYKEGTTYKAKNGTTGKVDYSDATNFAGVYNSIVSGISPAGTPTRIIIGPGDFNLTTGTAAFGTGNIGNISIEGMGMGVTNLILTSSISGNPAIFDFVGAVSGSQTNLTANASERSTVISVADASTFSVGDYILLRSTKDWVTSGQGKQGEIHFIRSKATNDITVDGVVFDTYNTADTANIIKLNMLQNITMKNFTIKIGSGYTQTGSFIRTLYCNNINLEGLELVDMPGSIVTSCVFRSCINSSMKGMSLLQTPTATFTGSGPYGMSVVSACRNILISNCVIRGRWRHAIVASEGTGTANQEGVCRSINIVGCISDGADGGHFDNHENGEGVSYNSCVCIGGNEHGFNIRAPSSTVKNCTVIGVPSYGIYFFGWADNGIISDNKIIGAGSGIRLGGDSVTSMKMTISGNSIEDCADHGIYLGNVHKDITITGNVIDNCNIAANNAGIHDNAGSLTDIIVTGNRILNCHRGIKMGTSSDYWIFNGNDVRDNDLASTLVGSNNKFSINLPNDSL